jgi:hypothetical protein
LKPRDLFKTNSKHFKTAQKTLKNGKVLKFESKRPFLKRTENIFKTKHAYRRFYDVTPKH